LDAGSRISIPRREPVPAIIPAGTSIFDLAAAESWCTHASASPAHLQSVYRHLFRRAGVLTAEALHSEAGLPRQLAAGVCSAFVPCSSRVVDRIESAGGRKLVVKLASGLRVETVLIMHEHRSTGRQRCTVCVSSQVGCARQCSFCATGTMGALAQLSAAEILEQVWHARQSVREDGGAEVRNVVFMGMGEPLDNLGAVLGSLRGLTHQSLFDLGARRITVSTVGGSADRIRRLADEAPRVRLALSLHAATQQLREQLIPSARAVPLDALGEALDYHATATGEGACLEYLLIAGVNDAPEHADALAAFCRERAGPAGFCNLVRRAPRRFAQAYRVENFPALCNLHNAPALPEAYAPSLCLQIPYNPTSAGALRGYETPSDDRVSAFHSRLRDLHGVHALVRWSSAAGRDAAGACGQLVVERGRLKGREGPTRLAGAV
jgi:adenine C2-methylase RlmN of 23S rRNA A2503 and tRNA A37